MATVSDNGIVSIRSGFGFADTLQRLLAVFDSHGIKVFATIDQQAEAAAVGLSMPPATLLIFGNPKAGTPLLVKQPLSALDLPLKVLVTESSPGDVRVSFNATAYILQRHGLPSEFSANLAPAERLIENVVNP